MTQAEIKKALFNIVEKMNANEIEAWRGDLENTIQAFASEDHYGDPDSDEPTVEYNGWYEDLKNLLKSIN